MHKAEAGIDFQGALINPIEGIVSSPLHTGNILPSFSSISLLLIIHLHLIITFNMKSITFLSNTM